MDLIFNYTKISYLFFCLSFLLIFCLPSLNSSALYFGPYSCYKSLGVPEYNLKLYNYVGQVPSFIRTRVDSLIYPKYSSSENIFESSYHHFIRFDGQCSDGFIFSNKGIPFKKWDINIYMYLGFRDEPFSEYSLYLGENFNLSPLSIYDTYARFLTLVSFRENSLHHIQPSSGISQLAVMVTLLSLPSNNEILCILAENNYLIKVRPTYENGIVPQEHISEIKIKHTRNGQQISEVNYFAYGCGSIDTSISNDLVLVEEQPRDTSIEYIFRYLLPQQLTETPPDIGVREGKFLLQNIEFIHVNSIRILRGNELKLYLFSPTISLEYCGMNSSQYLYYSSSGDLIHGLKYREYELSKDAISVYWQSLFELQSCEEQN